MKISNIVARAFVNVLMFFGFIYLFIYFFLTKQPQRVKQNVIKS